MNNNYNNKDKFVKAYILEIGKNYLIFLTADGQFIKISQSNNFYEIGDEVILDKSQLIQPHFNLKDKIIYFKDSFISSLKEFLFGNNFKGLKGAVAGIAVMLVLALGIYFGINYISKFNIFSSLHIAAAPENLQKNDLTGDFKDIEKNAQDRKDTQEKAMLSQGSSEQPSLAIAVPQDNKTCPDKGSDRSITDDEEQNKQSDSLNVGSENSLSNYIIFTKGKIILLSDEEGSPESIIISDEELKQIQSQPILFKGFYTIEELGKDSFLEYPDIKIGYKIEKIKAEDFEEAISNNETTGKKESTKNTLDYNVLTFIFTGIKEQKVFNGNINAELNDEKLINTRIFSMVFKDFKFGQNRTEEIFLSDFERSFNIIVYGYFTN